MSIDIRVHADPQFFTNQVHLFVRGSTLAASRAMVDRLAEETSVSSEFETLYLPRAPSGKSL